MLCCSYHYNNCTSIPGQTQKQNFMSLFNRWGIPFKNANRLYRKRLRLSKHFIICMYASLKAKLFLSFFMKILSQIVDSKKVLVYFWVCLPKTNNLINSNWLCFLLAFRFCHGRCVLVAAGFERRDAFLYHCYYSAHNSTAKRRHTD